MKEFVVIVYIYVCFCLVVFEVEDIKNYYDKYQVYLYVFVGVMLKDGFFVGIIMVLFFFLLVIGKVICDDIVMMGELIFIGKVLLIGGVKEKIIVACWVGIINLILLEDNCWDFEEFQDYIKVGINVYYVDYFDDVFVVVYLDDDFWKVQINLVV